MYLDGEIIVCIYELNEQGEGVAEPLEVFFAYQLLFGGHKEIVKRLARKRSIGDNRHAVGYARYLPTLTNAILLGIDLFETAYFGTSPDDRFEDGGECKWV